MLALVRQHRADAHAEDVLSGHTRLNAAASGFRRLLEDPGHRVVLAVLPGPNAADGRRVRARWPSGSPSSGWIRCPSCSATRRSPSTRSSSHREHRRRGAGVLLLAAAAAYAEESGASYVVAAVGGHEAERQRFFARMGFAPLTTRRIVTVESLDAVARRLAAPRRRRCRCRAGRSSAGVGRSARGLSA